MSQIESYCMDSVRNGCPHLKLAWVVLMPHEHNLNGLGSNVAEEPLYMRPATYLIETISNTLQVP